MIIKYFLKRMYQYSLGLGLMKKNYLFELSNVAFIDNTYDNRQVFKIDFLFYSLIIFIKWNRLLQLLKLHIWLIIDSTDLDILKLALAKNFSFICATNWIPGLLSNTNLVLKGSRFLFAEQTNKISVTSILSFAFFCCTENPAILPEMNAQLIPQFVLFNNINTSNFSHFIPLFIPSIKRKNRIDLESRAVKSKQHFTENLETLIPWETFTNKAAIQNIYYRYEKINTHFNCGFSNSILLKQKLWLLYLFLLYNK